MGYREDGMGAGLSPIEARLLPRFLAGACEHEVLESAAANAEPTTILNSRYLKVDGAGIVKVAYENDDGAEETEVFYADRGVFYPYMRIRMVYRYYTGTTALTCASYTDAGVLTTGAVKIYR